MRKSTLSIEAVKTKIDELVGKNIFMQVCRGRKQVRRYRGVVENAFPSVFVVRLTEIIEDPNKKNANTRNSHFENALSYSYSDVVCGEVIIKPEPLSAEALPGA